MGCTDHYLHVAWNLNILKVHDDCNEIHLAEPPEQAPSMAQTTSCMGLKIMIHVESEPFQFPKYLTDCSYTLYMCQRI